ncbi:MAG: phosphate/phosphite/phosphonate ABC transporter substrate-binding protein [Sulfuricurvum sp.]|nr:phosphate/phosphite/phosphonate ABC transporter substrate-binding protein [Sulfuricurvum sp.]
MHFLLLFLVTIFISVSSYAKPLVFGVVPQQSPLELIKAWKPLTDYLEKETGEKIVLKIERSIPEFEKNLYQGDYDFAYMNPSHYVIAHQKKGYLAKVRDKKNLVGILVVHKNSGIKHLSDMKGKRFLFPAPSAFAATMINKYELLVEHHINIESDENFRYVNSHDSVYKGVARGLGEIGGGIERTFNDLNDEETKSSLIIVRKTKPYPSHPFAFNPTLPKETQQKITQALLKTPDALLIALSMKHLVEIQHSEYSSIQTMMKLLPDARK